mmetsp:Transcript_11846/g.23263  ORF Transcript_11846/g.23263 Transcript_11846/m.23263 type:complete len:236 (+) Transcript_11846:1938-2645(+)
MVDELVILSTSSIREAERTATGVLLKHSKRSRYRTLLFLPWMSKAHCSCHFVSHTGRSTTLSATIVKREPSRYLLGTTTCRSSRRRADNSRCLDLIQLEDTGMAGAATRALSSCSRKVSHSQTFLGFFVISASQYFARSPNFAKFSRCCRTKCVPFAGKTANETFFRLCPACSTQAKTIRSRVVRFWLPLRGDSFSDPVPETSSSVSRLFLEYKSSSSSITSRSPSTDAPPSSLT